MRRWIKTSGTMPRTKAERVFVKWRCGLTSKAAYPVSGKGSLRWSWDGGAFDIMAYFAAPEEGEEGRDAA